MTFRSCFLLLVLCASFCLPGCSRTFEKSEAGKPAKQAGPQLVRGFKGSTVSALAPAFEVFAAPEDAFAPFQEAVLGEDYRRATQALTKESRQAHAGVLVFDMSLALANDNGKAEEIESLMNQFRADEEESQPPSSADPKNAAEMMRAIGTGVKSPSMFIGAAISIMEESRVRFMLPKGELTDLQIVDDIATGWVVAAAGQMPSGESNESETSEVATNVSSASVSEPATRQKIEFRKTQAGWKVHLPDELFEQQSQE